MTDTNKLKDFRHRSSVYDSMVKSPNRAMLRATGMTDDSFEKPIVGVISTWAENTPCNIHLHDFGKLAKEGVKEAGALLCPIWHHHRCRRHCHGNSWYAFLLDFS